MLVLWRGQFAHAFAELFDTLADGRPHFRQPLRAKYQERDHEYDDQIDSMKTRYHLCVLSGRLYNVRYVLTTPSYEKILQTNHTILSVPSPWLSTILPFHLR